MVLGGKLSFKGDKPKKKAKRPRDTGGGDDDDDDDADLEALAAQAQNEPILGEGKLTTSGVVVMGTDTNFVGQLVVGDTVLVSVADRFRGETRDESRAVTMVLGKTSANLDAPFSCDITVPTPFMLLKRTPDLAALKAARAEERKRQRRLDEESSTVTYKTLKPGGSSTWKVWQTVTEKVASGTTREDMLRRREKEKSDKHCK